MYDSNSGLTVGLSRLGGFLSVDGALGRGAESIGAVEYEMV